MSHEILFLIAIWGIGASNALSLSDIPHGPRRIVARVCNFVAMIAFVVLCVLMYVNVLLLEGD